MEENKYLFIGTKEEVDDCKREIDYRYTKKIVQSEDYSERYEHYYNNLTMNSKNHVDNAIYTLTDRAEYLGYNLRQMLKWFNESEDEFKISVLTDSIVEQYNLTNKSYLKFIKKNELGGLPKKINELSKRVSVKDKNMKFLIKNICNNFLISEDLIYKGEGYIYVIEPDELLTSDYKNFVDDAHMIAYDTAIEFFMTYKTFLKEEYPNKPKRANIIKKEYAKIKKDGAYFLLRDTKTYERQAKCVNDLIAYLYVLENILKQ